MFESEFDTGFHSYPWGTYLRYTGTVGGEPFTLEFPWAGTEEEGQAFVQDFAALYAKYAAGLEDDRG